MEHFRKHGALLAVTVLGVLCAWVGYAAAQEGKRYTLYECIYMALQFSPEIKEVRHDVEIARSRLAEAKAYQWPQIDALGLAGPVSHARGNQVESDYRSDHIEGVGPFGSIDVQLVQPLYTFGKITAAKKAADYGIRVEQSRVQQKAADVALRIKEYYYGLVFASDALNLVEEVGDHLNKGLDRTRRLLAVESAQVTEMDLNKLEAFSGMVSKFRNEASKSRDLAREALRTFMGLESGYAIQIADDSLEPLIVSVEDLSYYVQQSYKLRPEFAQLKEGLMAKEALIEVARADYYPTFFLGGLFSYAYAPDRDRVTNPWIFDRFNHTAAGVALGLKWAINFGITGAHVDRSKAEFLKLKQTQNFAESGIPLQVEKTYREFTEARANIEDLGVSQKAARKWLIQASANYDLGIADSKELADALVAYGTIRMDYLKSVYNFNLGYANLVQASGLSTLEIVDRY